MCAVCSAEVVPYRVAGVTKLNVREKPSEQAKKMGVLAEGDTVTVVAIDAPWAKIDYNGKVAYVNCIYLKKNEPENLVKKKNEDPYFVKNLLPLSLYGERWSWIIEPKVALAFVWAILILSCFLLWTHRVRENWLEGWRYKLNLVVFLLLNIVEIIYMMGHGEQALWFSKYAGDEALVVFVYLVLYIPVTLICINQWCSLTATLDDIQMVHSMGIGGRRIGIYSMPLCLLGYMASRLYWQPGMALSLGILAVLQSIQIYLMIKRFVQLGSLKAGILWSVVYLIGMVGIVYMLTNIVALLVLFLLFLLVIGVAEILHSGLGLGSFVSFVVTDRYGNKTETFVDKKELVCRNCAHYSLFHRSCFVGETPRKVHEFGSCNQFQLGANAEITDISGRAIRKEG